jgi:S1-C subfamily serine protease
MNKNLLTVVLVSLVTCAFCRAQAKAELPEMIKRVRRSVVQITVFAQAQNNDVQTLSQVTGCPFIVTDVVGPICIVGTGYFVNDKGDVVTAAHVAEEMTQVLQKLDSAHIPNQHSITVALPNIENSSIEMGHNYATLDFKIRDTDTLHDIALLSLNDPRQFKGIGHGMVDVPGLGIPDLTATTVTFDLRRPEDGESVYTCGFPLNAEALTTTTGTVATAWGTENLLIARAHQRPEKVDVYRLNLTANPGNSGGPTFASSNGAVVGMVVELFGPTRNIAILVPSHYIAEFLTGDNITWNAVKPDSVKK